ncbi:MAG: MTH1187 family thiamine-binding protein [Anaerolineales bacterium]|nr:MTH1187 family thiamine-binding protein [Anaerolineales bacterium]
MKVIVDFTIVPLGAGVSLSPYVAACEQILRGAGVKVQLHANGTNLEGEWDEVLAAVKRCHEEVHRMGAPRIFSALKFNTRTDRGQTMEEKIESVEKRMRTGSGSDA